MLRKKDGFPGEASIVLPESIKRDIRSNHLINSLYLTDIGYYPNAQYHFIERKKGIPEHILIYVIEGTGFIETNQQKLSLSKNHFFIIPAFEAHQYVSDTLNPWTIYWIHFSGEKSNFFSDQFSKKKYISPSTVSRIEERIQLFHEIIENLQMGYSRQNLEYVNLCLYHLLASFLYIDQYRALNLIRKNDPVQKSILYMKENLDQNLHLSNLAEYVGFSSSHYSKIFIEKTRKSPIDYLIQLKIQNACQLLDLSKLNISEIATQLGYSDPYYFSRIFKRVMGVSPLNYRKRNI